MSNKIVGETSKIISHISIHIQVKYGNTVTWLSVDFSYVCIGFLFMMLMNYIIYEFILLYNVKVIKKNIFKRLHSCVPTHSNSTLTKLTLKKRNSDTKRIELMASCPCTNMILHKGQCFLDNYTSPEVTHLIFHLSDIVS